MEYDLKDSSCHRCRVPKEDEEKEEEEEEPEK